MIGTCDSDDKSSLSDISQVPHDPLAEEQDQIIAEDVVTMSRPVGVPSGKYF